MESTKDYEHYFATLNELREQGDINMMSAPSVLRELYALERAEAYDIFKAWTKSLRQNTITHPIFEDEKEEDPNGEFLPPVLMEKGSEQII